jgi:hypothetical protein
MEWIIFIVLGLFIVGQTVSNMNTRKRITQALESRPESLSKMLDSPKPEIKHRLSRTWIVSSREVSIPAGWRWKCSCGVWGVSEDARMNTSLGTEETAIAGWEKHSAKYLEANHNEYKELYEKEQAEFAEYRRLCYCKDANDALAKWKD